MERGPEKLRLWVPGQPAGAGSKTPMPKGRMVGGRFRAVLDRVGRPVFYVKPASEKTLPWMRKVTDKASQTWGQRAPLDGPLWLDAFFYENRTSSHYLKRKSGDVLRPDAPAYPDRTESHDWDKMLRALADSLTNAGVIVDDKRIIGGEAWKDFVENENAAKEPCAFIRLGVMDHATVADAEIPSPAPEGQAALV